MSFKKVVENFKCDNCGVINVGSGFTNHCSQCLWSKHVDVDPGDRAEGCGGMMKPVEFDKVHGIVRVLHKCQACGFERWGSLVPGDNLDAALNV